MSSRTRLRSARVAFTPIVAAILVAFLLGRSESVVTYTAINLGTVEQGSTAVVRGPNAAGTAVGAGRTAGHAPRAPVRAGRPARDCWTG